MSIEEKKELCSKVLIMWVFKEKSEDMTKHDPDVADMFISKILLKKFEVFGVDIVLPDPLLMILDICCESNPGQVQIILKDLLNDIKKRRGNIPKGYVIASMDFSLCFPSNFPITEIEHINKKYMKLWDEQKKEKNGTFDSDNKCDTAEWWLEVMGQ